MVRKVVNKKSSEKEGLWKGFTFEGLVNSALSLFSSSKNTEKKLKKIKDKDVKKLVKNSKAHAKEFVSSTKKLAKNISKDVKDFKKSIKSTDLFEE